MISPLPSSSITVDGGSGVDSITLTEPGVREFVAGFHAVDGTQLRGLQDGVVDVFFGYRCSLACVVLALLNREPAASIIATLN